MRLLRTAAALCSLALTLPAAHAVELRISAPALEHTLEQQLFASPDGKHFLRGDDRSACSIYAESPSVHFETDRIVVHLRVSGKLGSPFHGDCLGLHLTRDVDVSLLPQAEGENIGFRDARIDKLSGSRELDMLLMPFLSHRVPSSLKVNAADQIRKVLSNSTQRTGYDVSLDNLKIHSMTIEGDALVVDVDGAVSVK